MNPLLYHNSMISLMKKAHYQLTVHFCMVHFCYRQDVISYNTYSTNVYTKKAASYKSKWDTFENINLCEEINPLLYHNSEISNWLKCPITIFEE